MNKNKERITKVGLEACTLCQLDCPGCGMRIHGNYCEIGGGFLTLANFKKFLALNPNVREINLAHMGEVFLNPQLANILRYAHSHQVDIDIWDVNFNHVDDEVLELMVTCGVRNIKFSIDGASPEAYAWYRRGGDFNKVINNIKKLNNYKKLHRSTLPMLHWQYILFPSNDNLKEINKAKKMAQELGMNEVVFVKDICGHVPSNLEMIKKETGLDYATPSAHSQHRVFRWLRCYNLWNYPRINYDGRVLGCCGSVNDYGGEGVNAFEMSLEKIYQLPLIRDTQAMLMGKKDKNGQRIVRKDSPCFKCDVYQNKIAGENWYISEQELEDSG